jgi:hypothetical protein
LSAELNACLTSSVLVVGCFIGMARIAIAQEKQEVTAESYQVYSAVLTQQFGSWFKGEEPVVIMPHTVLEPQGHEGYQSCHAEVAKDAALVKLLDKLVAKTQEFRIAPKLQLPGPYKMLKGNANIRANKEPGIVFLSAVEFSKDHSKALVLVGHSCGGLCGGGSVRSLEKRCEGWYLSKKQPNCGWIN